jgi:hypothetical protein
MSVANPRAPSKITYRPICSMPGTTVTGGCPPSSSATRRACDGGCIRSNSPVQREARTAPGVIPHARAGRRRCSRSDSFDRVGPRSRRPAPTARAARRERPAPTGQPAGRLTVRPIGSGHPSAASTRRRAWRSPTVATRDTGLCDRRPVRHPLPNTQVRDSSRRPLSGNGSCGNTVRLIRLELHNCAVRLR